MRIKFIRGGQMLVEVVLAFGITLVALIAILQMTSRSVQTSGVSNRQSQATAYGRAGITWLQTVRGTDSWSSLLTYAGSGTQLYCLNGTTLDSSIWTLNLGACTDYSLGGMYKRELEVESFTEGTPAKQGLRFSVVVSWIEDNARVANSTQVIEFFAQ